MLPPQRTQRDGAPRRVLLVGWDAADWRMIDPLMAAGLMPTMKQMVDGGVRGNLASLRPMLSPMLWNSIATGKLPQEHGVHGFTEPNADGTAVQPVSSTSRRCKALWNMLTQCGLRSNVVGWYASHPAEPIRGVMVSNQFEQFTVQDRVRTDPPKDSVHPAEALGELAPLRVGPDEIDPTAILPFVPTAAELAKGSDHRLGKLQHLLSQTATIHATATHLMQSTEWDFAAVYYEGIDRFGHEFMHCHPPKMEQVSQEEFDAYKQCMVGIYRFHDMMLETLLTLAGDDTAVVLISDHGYYHDSLRPDPREGKSGPTEWHRPFGVFAGVGPGLAQGSRVYGASLLDIAPTVLQLLGLPAAYDMPGRVLAEVLDTPDVPGRIESWEEVEGPSGQHPDEMRVDPAETQVVLQQLVALGYIEAPGDDAAKAVKDTLACNQMNLLQSLVDSRQYKAALSRIDEFDEEYQQETSVKLLRAYCHMALGESGKARETLEPLRDDPDPPPRMHMMLGSLEFAAGNTEQALHHLEQVSTASVRLPGLHCKLGEVYAELNRFEEAEAAFRMALEIDADSPAALAGLARVRFEAGDPKSALEYGLAAAELVHFFPRAHYLIGRSRLAMGDGEGAVEALELCLRQSPGMTVAKKELTAAYRSLGRSEDARRAELVARGFLKHPG